MQTIDEKTKHKIIAVISALMPDVKIYLFGSRARGTNSRTADIDIALDGGEKHKQWMSMKSYACLKKVILCIK